MASAVSHSRCVLEWVAEAGGGDEVALVSPSTHRSSPAQHTETHRLCVHCEESGRPQLSSPRRAVTMGYGAIPERVPRGAGGATACVYGEAVAADCRGNRSGLRQVRAIRVEEAAMRTAPKHTQCCTGVGHENERILPTA
ncbi:hypothetical protein MHYP_G00333980 [Metynnis hypsauchen]